MKEPSHEIYKGNQRQQLVWGYGWGQEPERSPLRGGDKVMFRHIFVNGRSLCGRTHLVLGQQVEWIPTSGRDEWIYDKDTCLQCAMKAQGMIESGGLRPQVRG